jgi:hypothetical protein
MQSSEWTTPLKFAPPRFWLQIHLTGAILEKIRKKSEPGGEQWL